MRCKICSKVVRSSATKKRHCWNSNQQCPKCHYLGDTHMHMVKYDTEETLINNE